MAPVVTLEGRKLKLTNLDKPLYPEGGFTKGQVIDYYRRVSEYMLPHLKDRPVTLKRFPNGVAGESFYEKQCPSHRPEWVETSAPGKLSKNYCIINDLASLVWIANLASIEVHTLLATQYHAGRPTMIVFDLDPGAPATLLDCLEVSLIMREMLRHMGLQCLPKTSGGKGLHFYLPLNTAATYEQTRYFAKAMAQVMEKHYPERVVAKMSKKLRPGKVFVDWSQNVRHKTTVCAYSLRAQQSPTVSMPVTWRMVEDAVKSKDAAELVFDPVRALRQVTKQGDALAAVLTLKQSLPPGAAGRRADDIEV